MKISDERLQELIDKVGVSSLPLYGRDALAAFRELQQYRDALRFRSFDESLKNDRPYNRFTGPWVELKDEEGRVYRCLHSGDAESYSRKGYTGWRYPVGDLVGGGE